MAVRIITPPATDPITLTEAKSHLRVDHTDDDTLITGYITAATRYAEEFTGRAFITQTLELVLDEFRAQIQIPRPPLQSVVSVKYDDSNGLEQTLTEGVDFLVDTASQPGWVVAVESIWPETIETINSVRIRYVAGYVDGNSPPSENVPRDIKSAILLIIGSLYSVRETVVVGAVAQHVPWGADQILRQRSVVLPMA